jgi:hypothetical protein
MKQVPPITSKASPIPTIRRNIESEDGLIFPVETIPLELHAKIAAMLLKGDEFEEASEGALTLLNFCWRKLERARLAVMKRRAVEKEFVRLGVNEDPLPFKLALRIITGQKRLDRAEPDFLSFVQAKYANWSKPRLSGWWDIRQRIGMSIDQVVKFRDQFHAMRAEGDLGKRKPNRKKSLGRKKSR